MYDAVVVGGGIVGASVAYHLVRSGVETLMIDRQDEGRATRAGAGILCPTASSCSESEAWYEFAIDAVRYYPDLVEDLRATQSGNTGYAQTGLLAVAMDDDEIDPFERSLTRARNRAEAYPEKASTVRELDPGEAVKRCRAIARPQRAFLVEEGASVNGAQFAGALRRAAGNHGLDLVQESVNDLEIEDDQVTAAVTAEGRYEADTVVVAGGAWSPEIADRLAVDIPVEPHRGQIVHFQETDYDTGEWPVLSGFRGHYVVPWPDRIVAGATREEGVGFEPWATGGGLQTVLDEALRVAPGLESARFDEVRVGLRPASADGLPVLGRVPGVDGAYLTTGHGATGLQVGPYSGKLVAEAIVKGENETLDPYRVDRF